MVYRCLGALIKNRDDHVEQRFIMAQISREYPDMASPTTQNHMYNIMKCFIATGLTEYVSVSRGGFRWVGPQGMIDKL